MSTRSRSSTRARSSRCRSSSTAATAWPGRWSARCSSASASTGRRPTGSPTASSPTTSPTRCCPRTASFIIDRVLAEGADLGIAWDGDADRCFFIDDEGEFVDGDFLTALLAQPRPRQASPAPTILYDVRASRAVPDTVAARRRDLVREPRRPRVLQERDARARRRVRRRGLRPLLLPRLLVRGLRDDPGAAGARAALGRGHADVRAASGRFASATSSPARSTPRSPTRRRR